MNIVVLLAGGSGKRLGKDIPKQFVDVLGKPLIVYALEIYERSALIDMVEVVCVPDYIEWLHECVKKYRLTKVKWIVPGGSSCQESTKNGIFFLENRISNKDMLMFNMSTSVFVNDEIMKDSLEVAEKYGNAFAAMQCIYNNAETFDGICSEKIHYKETHRTLNLPWTAPFKTFDTLYRRAYEHGIEMGASSYAPTLFLAMGEKLYFSKDTSLNKLHITTKEDLEIVTAILRNRKKTEVVQDEIFNGNR